MQQQSIESKTNALNNSSLRELAGLSDAQFIDRRGLRPLNLSQSGPLLI